MKEAVRFDGKDWWIVEFRQPVEVYPEQLVLRHEELQKFMDQKSNDAAGELGKREHTAYLNVIGNPGVSKAKEAAASVGGRLAVPQSNANEVRKSIDFNDLCLVSGAQSVIDCIGESVSVAHDGDVCP